MDFDIFSTGKMSIQRSRSNKMLIQSINSQKFKVDMKDEFEKRIEFAKDQRERIMMSDPQRETLFLSQQGNGRMINRSEGMRIEHLNQAYLRHLTFPHMNNQHYCLFQGRQIGVNPNESVCCMNCRHQFGGLHLQCHQLCRQYHNNLNRQNVKKKHPMHEQNQMEEQSSQAIIHCTCHNGRCQDRPNNRCSCIQNGTPCTELCRCDAACLNHQQLNNSMSIQSFNQSVSSVARSIPHSVYFEQPNLPQY